MRTSDQWSVRASLYAFIGNSLLDPMSDETAFGLEPSFWEEVASEAGLPAEAVEPAAAVAQRLAAMPRPRALERLGVAHAKLFVGPGTPAAPPWETLHRSEGGVLFGKATFDMRSELRSLGLRVYRQLEDHMGIELLLASALCQRIAEGDMLDGEAVDRLHAFVEAHPAAWVSTLREQVGRADETGYYEGLLGLAAWLLREDSNVAKA